MNITAFQRFASIASLSFALAACSGGGGGGGSDGDGASTPATTTLASGTFTRSFAPAATGDNVMPFGSGSFGDVRHQVLYTAAEVGASGRISALRFRYFSNLASEVTCPNTTVRLGHTSLAALTASFAGNVDRSSLHTAIDNATVTVPAGNAGNWFSVALATPFYYNGTDNLVVEVERTTSCGGNVHIATANAPGNRRAESEATDTLAGVAQHDTATASSVDVTHPLQQFVFSGGDSRVSYSGSTTSNGIPFAQSNLPEFRHAQLLYRASEITGSGPITGIAFVHNQPATSAANYFVTVKLAHTSLTTLTNTFASNFNGTPVTVARDLAFNVPAGIPAGSPIWIPLTGSFDYNGTDNLIVDIEVTGGFAPSTFMRGMTATGRRLWAAVGAATGTVDNTIYEALFRFHGSTMDVAPASNSAVSQAFGLPAGGQVQNLYRSTYLGTGGRITSLAIRLSPFAAPNAATIPNFRIHMGHTDRTSLAIADSYASNMNENSLVYSGALGVPAGARAGDWITIPLQTPFTYDPSRNLVVRFAGDNPGAANAASAHWGDTEFAGRSVGRNDNAVDVSGTPAWGWDGAVNVRFGIEKQ